MVFCYLSVYGPLILRNLICAALMEFIVDELSKFHVGFDLIVEHLHVKIIDEECLLALAVVMVETLKARQFSFVPLHVLEYLVESSLDSLLGCDTSLYFLVKLSVDVLIDLLFRVNILKLPALVWVKNLMTQKVNEMSVTAPLARVSVSRLLLLISLFLGR